MEKINKYFTLGITSVCVCARVMKSVPPQEKLKAVLFNLLYNICFIFLLCFHCLENFLLKSQVGIIEAFRFLALSFSSILIFIKGLHHKLINESELCL